MKNKEMVICSLTELANRLEVSVPKVHRMSMYKDDKNWEFLCPKTIVVGKQRVYEIELNKILELKKTLKK